MASISSISDGSQPPHPHDFLFVEESSAVFFMFCARRLWEAVAGSSSEGRVGRMNDAGFSGDGAGLSNLLLLCGGLESECFGLLFYWNK